MASTIDRPVGLTPRGLSPGRAALAALVLLGPIADGIGVLTEPYGVSDNSAAQAAKIATHQGAEGLYLWINALINYTYIPGLLIAGVVALSQSRRLGGAALAVLTVAILGLATIGPSTPDIINIGGAKLGLDPATTHRARTIALNAGVSTLLLGTDGIPIYLGRKVRFVTTGQRSQITTTRDARGRWQHTVHHPGRTRRTWRGSSRAQGP